MKRIISICIFILLFIFSCSHNIKEFSRDQYSYIIWAHSDVQPRSPAEKIYYENAVKDMAENFKTIDMALFAGDIVQFSNFKEIFEWYLNTRKKAPVKEWYEIAGNHEWRSIDLYKRLINPHLHYSVTRGNLLILMISNEKWGRPTYISEETFEWWRNLVINNQDKIIITVTHGTLQGNGLLASNLNRLIIERSDRFADILKKYRVDIWISGHSHLPYWLPKMHLTNENLGGTTFIDLGAIREDFLTSSESRILFFEQGSSVALMKIRDHSEKKYKSDNIIIPLSHPFLTGISGK